MASHGNPFLAPALFNLYTRDTLVTSFWKFLYANDTALATQASSLQAKEKVINSHLWTLETYSKAWCLKPNDLKTLISAFHLNNHQAKVPLKVEFYGLTLSHDHNAWYIGVTLDQMLSYCRHQKEGSTSFRSSLAHPGDAMHTYLERQYKKPWFCQ